jgi:RND family efflux transporter MFP subunit
MKRSILLALALAALAMSGCRRAQADPSAPLPSPIHVAQVKVEAKPMPKTLALAASLVANQQSEVAANASGRVQRTLVERGSEVKVGAALAQLDTRTAELSHLEARASLKSAESQEQEAQSECKRNQDLYAKGAISKQEWERISSTCESSQGSAAAARARADLAEKTLQDSTVRAPFSGMVGERYVSVGEYVSPATKVALLVELDPLRLQLTVDEANIGQVHVGQTVRFTVDAYPQESFVATVKYMDPTVRSQTRDMVVEALVDNKDRRLRPGMFAQAYVELTDEPLPVVPKSALRQDASTTRLFAVVEGRVEERIVQVGPEREGQVAILDGLKAGETVVADPGDQVKDGVPVS